MKTADDKYIVSFAEIERVKALTTIYKRRSTMDCKEISVRKKQTHTRNKQESAPPVFSKQEHPKNVLVFF